MMFNIKEKQNRKVAYTLIVVGLGIVLGAMLTGCGPTGYVIDGPRGKTGKTGLNGTNGADGSNGLNGSSCTVEQAVNGALITCPDGSMVLVLNGTNGLDGEDGEDGQDAPPTAYSIVDIVNPCGDDPGVLDEVFLRLANGLLIASFSDNTNGKNTRFGVILPGSYVTTDGGGCTFTVNGNYDIVNENEHF